VREGKRPSHQCAGKEKRRARGYYSGAHTVFFSPPFGKILSGCYAAVGAVRRARSPSLRRPGRARPAGQSRDGRGHARFDAAGTPPPVRPSDRHGAHTGTGSLWTRCVSPAHTCTDTLARTHTYSSDIHAIARTPSAALQFSSDQRYTVRKRLPERTCRARYTTKYLIVILI